MSACTYTTYEISLTLYKLDSEINARFMLNEHGDPHILMNEFKLHEIIYNVSRFEFRNQADRVNKYQLYSNKNQEMLGFEIYFLYIYVSVRCVFVSFKNSNSVEIMLEY